MYVCLCVRESACTHPITMSSLRYTKPLSDQKTHARTCTTRLYVASVLFGPRTFFHNNAYTHIGTLAHRRCRDCKCIYIYISLHAKSVRIHTVHIYYTYILSMCTYTTRGVGCANAAETAETAADEITTAAASSVLGVFFFSRLFLHHRRVTY